MNIDNVYIWDARMRNPEPLSKIQNELITMCPYLSRIREYYEYTNFNEFYGKSIHRSFTWACDENCVCVKPYFI